MDEVQNILTALLRRAISEHGREAPALTDIVIERAYGRLEPRLSAHFANGYSTWAPIRPADCYAYCEQHGVWELASLRRALLREAHDIYEPLCAAHLAGLTRTSRRWVGAGFFERFRRRAPVPAGTARADTPQPAHNEAEAHPRRQEAQRRLLEWWSQQRHEYARTAFFGQGLSTEVGSKRAQERGLRLLREHLASGQRQQYDRHGYFDVVGGKTGKRYRIRHGRQMNIEQLDKNGRRVCGWCFYPEGNLVAGDIMLAQKVALELFEVDALRIANRF